MGRFARPLSKVTRRSGFQPDIPYKTQALTGCPVRSLNNLDEPYGVAPHVSFRIFSRTCGVVPFQGCPQQTRTTN